VKGSLNAQWPVNEKSIRQTNVRHRVCVCLYVRVCFCVLCFVCVRGRVYIVFFGWGRTAAAGAAVPAAVEDLQQQHLVARHLGDCPGPSPTDPTPYDQPTDPALGSPVPRKPEPETAPERPYQTIVQNRFTVGNTEGA
jgi:hypothetical protein